MNITPELRALQTEIEGYAHEFGLDYFEVIFELCTFDQINAFASYGGFPSRYPHWSFGMEYERLKKGYQYGLSKIYEMVINTDPCYAYLMDCNPLVDQKLVMAHVYAHCDFFKNNFSFEPTNRKMLDEMANHASRVRRYMDRYGEEAVESFLDVCLAVDDLIDPHAPFRRKEEEPWKDTEENGPGVEEEIAKLKAAPYLDSFINPKEFVQEQRKKLLSEKEAKQHRFPPEPERDVLGFLMNYAPLRPWQRDILSIVREEAYYFAPQGQTKIMNEGWASYWHSTIMTRRVLSDAEVIDFADHHSGTVAMSRGQLNPYKIGLELFRHIEERWNKGRFGKDYQECESWEQRRHWDTGAGLGREKIFEVRKHYNDLTFIDTFLTEEFCNEHQIFTYQWNPNTHQYEINSRDFAAIKQKLLFQLTNHGRPIIRAVEANENNRGELRLEHFFEGVEMDLEKARYALECVQKIWQRPVHLDTEMDGEKVRLTCDGKNVTQGKV